MNERLKYHLDLLQNVLQRLERAQATADGIISDEIIHQLKQLIELLTQQSPDAYDAGRDWLSHILTHVPQLTPAIDRDLLWFFGGECLHFMGDEELELFQQIDEQEALHESSEQPFDRVAFKTLLGTTSGNA